MWRLKRVFALSRSSGWHTELYTFLFLSDKSGGLNNEAEKIWLANIFPDDPLSFSLFLKDSKSKYHNRELCASNHSCFGSVTSLEIKSGAFTVSGKTDERSSSWFIRTSPDPVCSIAHILLVLQKADSNELHAAAHSDWTEVPSVLLTQPLSHYVTALKHFMSIQKSHCTGISPLTTTVSTNYLF